MRRSVHWLISWGALIVLWQLFTNTFAAPEVIAGVGAAAVAATAGEVVRGQNLIHFHPRPAWLWQAHRLPAAVLRDCLIVLGALWRRIVRRERVEGAFTTVAFSSGGDDARSAARRALYVTAISLTPNTFVVGIDRDNDTMLIHQLVPTHPTTARELLFGR